MRDVFHYAFCYDIDNYKCFFFCGNAMKITLPNEDIQNQEKRIVRHSDKRKWQYSPIICIKKNNETIKTQLDNILYDCCCCCCCKQNSATSNPKVYDFDTFPK